MSIEIIFTRQRTLFILGSKRWEFVKGLHEASHLGRATLKTNGFRTIREVILLCVLLTNITEVLDLSWHCLFSIGNLPGELAVGLHTNTSMFRVQIFISSH